MPTLLEPIIVPNLFPFRPHRLAGATMLDGQPVRRRVIVQRRSDLVHIAATVTHVDGLFEFRHLPEQTLAEPYVVTCFDDRPDGFGNALIFDRVYQVDDNGNPPQT